VPNVVSMVRGCHRCSLADSTVPVPWSGQSDIVVIGEAPGKQEAEQGLPFIGPAGKKLRGMLRLAGFNPNDIAYVNAVSCYPDGTPTKKHIDACYMNLQAQLREINPTWAIIVGAEALQSIYPAAKITRDRGLWFQIPKEVGLKLPCWTMATYHPAAVLRNPELEETVIGDLLQFHNVYMVGQAFPGSQVDGADIVKGRLGPDSIQDRMI
jgi:uracil-DNA glycosylase family 4